MSGIFKFTFSVIFLIVTLFMLVGCKETDENQDIKDLIKVISDEKLEFKLYYYGKNENVLDLNLHYVHSFEEIVFDDSHKNTFIVINNLDNNLTFDIEKLSALKTQIEEYNYSFYYFGNTEIEKFYASGLLLHERLDPRALSFGYVREGNRYLNSIGTWDITANEIAKENDILFLELVLYEIKYQININSLLE